MLKFNSHSDVNALGCIYREEEGGGGGQTAAVTPAPFWFIFVKKISEKSPKTELFFKMAPPLLSELYGCLEKKVQILKANKFLIF